MGEWLGLNENQYLALLNEVTIAHIIALLDKFDARDHKISKISLAYYVDNGGQSDCPVFIAIFNTLPPLDKLDVIRYAEEFEVE